MEDYSKLIEKQEAERLNHKQGRLDRMKNLVEKFGDSNKVDENVIRIGEEKRFLKEFKDREKKDLEKEKEDKEKKRLLNIDIKSTLDKQINDKKAMFIEIKNHDKVYEKELHTQLYKYNIERDQKINDVRERTKKYKEELTIQVNEKSKYKTPSMDEKERLINRIDEILPKK